MERKVNCQLCLRDAAKYVCPRCNIPYCSLSCYRSPIHTVCSEAFYRECVTKELISRPPDDEGRSRMLEILERNRHIPEFYSDDDCSSTDEEDDLDLAARMADIDLNDVNAIWERLTPGERTDFLASIAREEPIPWEPWWSHRQKPSLITPIDSPHRPYADSCPPLPPTPPSLSSLSSRPPAPEILNGVLNALAAYSLVARHYDGDSPPPGPAAALLLRLSPVLGQGIVYATAEEALSSVVFIAQEIGLGVVNNSDAAAIALGPKDDDPAFYVLVALNHMHSIIAAALSEAKMKTQSEVSELPPILAPLVPLAPRSQLRAASRKLTYYISWTYHCYPKLFGQFKESLVTATKSPPVEIPHRT